MLWYVAIPNLNNFLLFLRLGLFARCVLRWHFGRLLAVMLQTQTIIHAISIFRSKAAAENVVQCKNVETTAVAEWTVNPILHIYESRSMCFDVSLYMCISVANLFPEIKYSIQKYQFNLWIILNFYSAFVFIEYKMNIHEKRNMLYSTFFYNSKNTNIFYAIVHHW